MISFCYFVIHIKETLKKYAVHSMLMQEMAYFYKSQNSLHVVSLGTHSLHNSFQHLKSYIY